MFVTLSVDQKNAISSFDKKSGNKGKLQLENLLKTRVFVNILSRFSAVFKPNEDFTKWIAIEKDLNRMGFELPDDNRTKFPKELEIIIQVYVVLMGVWVIGGCQGANIRSDSMFDDGTHLFYYAPNDKALIMRTPKPELTSRFCMFSSLALIHNINNSPEFAGTKQALARAIKKAN